MSEDTDYDSWKHFQEQVRTSLRVGGAYIYPVPEKSRGAPTTRHGTYPVSLTSPVDIRGQLGWGGLCSKEVYFEGGRYKLYWVTEPHYREENLIVQCFGLLGICGGIVITPYRDEQEGAST